VMRGVLGWILTVLGIVVAVYRAIQLLIGGVIAIRGEEVTAHLGVAASGVVILGLGASIAWGGLRLRRPRGRAR
jgi:hypothetical protein